MSERFRHLEFSENPREGKLAHSETTRTRDANMLLQAARDEHRWGRFEPALRQYTRCLEVNRAVVPAWVGQVQVLVELSEHHEARVWSDKALELFRNNGELLAAKAQACARLGDQRTAMASSDGSLQVPGSSAWRWIVRGEVLLANSQKHFEDCFRKALTEPIADWFDRVIIARVYEYHRRWTNALVYLKQAIEIEPAHGYIWFEMANCQKQLGLLTAARTSYERCLELRADYREASTALDAVDRATPANWLRGLWRRWSN